MTRRSRGREVALQLLFQREHNPKMDRAGVEPFVRERIREEPIRKFCLFLFDGVVAKLAEIDPKISAAAENWRLARMPTVDRNILRLGAYELLYMQDTPAAVAFDEAIELARRYGTADSSAFVNGVLDRLAKSQESEAKSQESGVGSQESEVRSQESEVRSQESEVGSQESNANTGPVTLTPDP